MRRLNSLLIIALLFINVVIVQGQEIPTQLLPDSGATLTSPVINFQWSAVDNVRVYVLKVKNTDGTYRYKGKATPSVAGCDDLSSCSFTPSDLDWLLKHNTTYVWKVVAKLNDGTQSNSTARRFTTNFPVPGAFSLISPANLTSFQDSYTPSFEWNPAANAELYKVIIKNPNGVKVLKQTMSPTSCGTTCQMSFTTSLRKTGTYKWIVVASNSYGIRKATAKFKIVGSAPAYATEMLRLVNIERCARGLAPLALNDKLNTAALKHSKDMANNNYFQHNSLDGRTPWDRIAAEGYFSGRSENIAAGNSDVPSTFTQWWTSTMGHRENILDASAREMGIGYAYNSGAKYRHYWTQVFGARSTAVLGVCP